MQWLQSLDISVLRFINETLSNPVFDKVMPLLSGKGSSAFFFPLVLIALAWLLWKGGTRGRLCVLMLVLIVWPGDSYICDLIKHAVQRPRPFVDIPDLNELIGRGRSFSMPSSHAANWFAATMILFVYFPRSWRFMLPMACLVSFSRVYCGMHYPSDVLAGAILGSGYAVAGMVVLETAWQWAGRKWFPLWWQQVPSLVRRSKREGDGLKAVTPAAVGSGDVRALLDVHWVRLGYVLIGVLLIVQWIYVGSGIIQLTEDEAYQWVWSKHLALSYFSKPPLIAYTQFLGTSLWGDNEFGVRFFSPVIAATLGFLLLRFFAREVSGRTGFFVVLIFTATPLLALGSTLMTVDPLSVLFWTAAMVAGWRAIQPEAPTSAWAWTGLWMALGFLSKYTQMFQWLCWALFFLLWKPARVHLRRPGPYVAAAINALGLVPVLIWNAQHQWITLFHVGHNAGVNRPARVRTLDFVAAEFFLLNPVFFVATIWAAIAFWRRYRDDRRLVYFFCMGAPVFLCYLLWSFRSRIQPNWIAPSILPLFCVMAIYWYRRWTEGVRAVKTWLIAGVSLGFLMVLMLHDTDLIRHVARRPLPAKVDPMTRVRGYTEMARIVDEARQRLQSEGKPVFLIADHYGVTGLLTFYLPEARTNVVQAPFVYYKTTRRPENQFYFWPGYAGARRGQNAIFVREIGAEPLVKGWLGRWLKQEKFENLVDHQHKDYLPPKSLVAEFESVTDLGIHNVMYRGRVFHTIQLFECRNLQ